MNKVIKYEALKQAKSLVSVKKYPQVRHVLVAVVKKRCQLRNILSLQLGAMPPRPPLAANARNPSPLERSRMSLSFSEIARRLDERHISIRSVAARLCVNQSHLLRVLRGDRPGSDDLRASLTELVESMPGLRSQEEQARLINAAVHVFFVKRGDFQSAVFEEMDPAAPLNRPKKRVPWRSRRF